MKIPDFLQAFISVMSGIWLSFFAMYLFPIEAIVTYEAIHNYAWWVIPASLTYGMVMMGVFFAPIYLYSRFGEG